MTPEQRGSVVFAITMLAQALANDDANAVALAKKQLEAVFTWKRGRTSRQADRGAADG